MGNWTQPICERCWIEKNTELVEGELFVRRPAIVKDASAVRCAYCDELTIMGIYVRDDPTKVPYPRDEDERGSDLPEGA